VAAILIFLHFKDSKRIVSAESVCGNTFFLVLKALQFICKKATSDEMHY
jgi:hypothetical protein